ncbi:MAG: hypothetical protein JNL70_01585 [Saprospiraceae bacterium]|nr:hypothetical protein [Saprospiraceae bacterium]
MDSALRTQIRDLIGAGKGDKALDLFVNWANTSGSDISNDLIGLKAQYSALKRNENLGLISYSEANMRRNQITNGVLTLLEDVGNASTTVVATTETRTTTVSTPNNSSNTQTTTDSKKTILFMGANPPGTRFIQLEVEHSRISTRVGNTFNLQTEKFLSAGDIPELISKYNPNIIHFSGHGKDPKTGEHGATNDTTRGLARLPEGYEQKGGIVVFDDDMRGLVIIEDESLDYLFDSTVNDLKVPLEVVVFNSCYSESQAKAIGKHVPYVVGSSRALDDDLALAFAEGFYFAMGEGKPIERAFVTGKQKVVLKKPKSKDLIVLYNKGVKMDL